MSLNLAYVLYLEHSYRYYVMARPLVTDAQFDALCVILADNWHLVDHRHKHLTDIEALRAGTGYQLEGHYPLIVSAPCEQHPSTPLYKVFGKMTFADKYEEQAHSVICMIRYGGIGGSVNTKLVRQIGDFLRGYPLAVTKPVLSLPPLPLPKPVVTSLPPLPLPGKLP